MVEDQDLSVDRVDRNGAAAGYKFIREGYYAVAVHHALVEVYIYIYI